MIRKKTKKVKEPKVKRSKKVEAKLGPDATPAEVLDYYYRKLPSAKRIIAKVFDRPFRRHAAKHPDEPHFSIVAAFYVWEIYRKAAGPRRYFSIVYNLYSAIIVSVEALILEAIVDKIPDLTEGNNFMVFLILVIILFLISILGIFLSRISSIVSLKNGQDTYCYVAQLVAEKYINTPLAVREDGEFADKFSRVREFAGTVNYVSSSLISVVTAVVGLGAAIVATLTISPIITLMVVVATIPTCIISMRLAKRHRTNYRRFSKDRRIAWEIEKKIVNSNSALEIELNDLNTTLVSRMVKSLRRGNEQDINDANAFFWPAIGSNALESTVTFGVLFVVAIQIAIGKLGIGSFVSVRTLLQNVTSSTTGFFGSLASSAEGLVNATDYMEFMETPERPNGDILVADVPTIEFKDVSFTYPKSDTPALQDINVTLKPGDSIAVVGANGAGKTTFIKLLIGAYQPTSGAILVNGLPLERIERKSYLDQIGALFQDYSRYEFATLGENIWFGDVSRAYNKKELQAALDMVGLGDLPSKYENGFDQVLSKDLDKNNATDLSGGQWQRLCIARAFYRSPNILILDEPTSAVDAQSEAEIFRNIINNQKDKTTIIISHRFSTVRKAKQIIVLDKGKVIENGTHEDLIKNKGLYKEMFEIQAEGYN